MKIDGKLHSDMEIMLKLPGSEANLQEKAQNMILKVELDQRLAEEL